MRLEELAQAFHDRLVSSVGAFVTGVYTNKPQDDESEDDANFPYVDIVPVTTSRFETDEFIGFQVLVDVNLFTRSTSAKADLAVKDAVALSLHRFDLPIVGADLIDCLYDGGTMFMDTDGKTRQYVSTFRVTYHLT